MGTCGTPPSLDDELATLWFEKSYTQWYNVVYARAYRLVRCHDDAEDVTQSAFLKYWKAIRTQTIANALAWLSCVARRQAIDVLRRRRQAQGESLTAHQCDLYDIASLVEATLIAHWVRRAVLNLAPIYRETLYQSYYCALSSNQIASATDVPIGTVKSRLRRAHALLRKRVLLDRAL